MAKKITFANDFLRKWLKKNKMTQVKFAREIEVSESAVSLYVRKKRVPEISVIYRMAKVMGCKTDDLLIEVEDA